MTESRIGKHSTLGRVASGGGMNGKSCGYFSDDNGRECLAFRLFEIENLTVPF